MKRIPIKIPELSDLPPDKWKYDAIGRKHYAEALSCILDNHANPMTMAINGSWGSGKTYLLNDWADDLSNEGCRIVKFNAWRDDFVKDPLVAIVGQFVSCLSEYEAFWLSVPCFLSVFKRISKDIVWKWLWNIVKAFLKNKLAIDVDVLAKTTLESRSQGLVNAYKGSIAYRDDFRERVEAIADAHYQQHRKPIVFLVDELDRCKPTFAIAVLERIKHLFNIRHTVFVIAVDIPQLSESIKSVYGNIDTGNYLRRFFDLELNLPFPDSRQFVERLWKRYDMDANLNSYALDSAIRRDFERFRLLVPAFADVARLSLREIENVVRQFMIMVLSGGTDVVLFPEAALILSVLKIRDRDLYTCCAAGEYDLVKCAEAIISISINDKQRKNSINVVLEVMFNMASSDTLGTLIYIANVPKVANWQEKYSRFYGEFFCSEHAELLTKVADERGYCDGARTREDLIACAKRLECFEPFHYPT